MCRNPVTLGGGRQIVNRRELDVFASAVGVKNPELHHQSYHSDSTNFGSYPSGRPTDVSFLDKRGPLATAFGVTRETPAEPLDVPILLSAKIFSLIDRPSSMQGERAFLPSFDAEPRDLSTLRSSRDDKGYSIAVIGCRVLDAQQLSTTCGCADDQVRKMSDSCIVFSQICLTCFGYFLGFSIRNFRLFLGHGNRAGFLLQTCHCRVC